MLGHHNVLLHRALSHGRKYAAFTLVELIVAIAIITVMLLLAVAASSGAQMVSRDAQRKTKVGEIAQKINDYFRSNARYPSESDFSFVWSDTSLTIPPQRIDLVGAMHRATATNPNATLYKYLSSFEGFLICAKLETGVWYKLGATTLECE